MLWVPGKDQLDSLNQICQQHRHKAEEKHRNRILPPRHLLISIYSADPINSTFNRPKEPSIAGEDPSHVDTQWAHTHQEHHKVNDKLHPSVGCHIRTSPRTEA